MFSKKLYSFAIVLLLLTSSCGISTATEPTPTLWIPLSPTPAPSPTSIELPTLIPTQSLPMLSLRAESACRVGPGEFYDSVANLETGRQVEILAKTETYWLVKYSVVTECWIVDQQININGDISAVPVITPRPTPSNLLPLAAPENVKLKVTCKKEQKFIDEVLLTWTDMSTAEDGFRVYRDGNVAATVPANTTQVVVVGETTSNIIHYYYVTAYNTNGEIKSQPQTIFCKKWE